MNSSMFSGFENLVYLFASLFRFKVTFILTVFAFWKVVLTVVVALKGGANLVPF